MEGKKEADSTVSCTSYESGERKWSSRNKRLVKKKVSLVYLLKGICSSQETCIDWLKNRGLIPKVMFCPSCSQKMKFEAQESALDGYVWLCKECKIDPPRFSTRHGSWLESKDASLVDILLFTYLWSHGFGEAQIAKETNMETEEVQQWDAMYVDICEAVLRKAEDTSEDFAENLKNQKDCTAIWREKNRYKDLFLEFLKDADSL